MNRLYKALIVILLSAFFPAGCASSNQGTFMEEHHLSLSPQGAFSFHTKAIDRDGNDVDFVENVTVAINETPCAERKGYKIVEAVFEADLSDLPEGTRIASLQIAFDKYTGTAFEYYRSASDEQPYEFEFDCGGNKVSVQMSYEIQRDTQKKSLTVIIRVKCPKAMTVLFSRWGIPIPRSTKPI